MHSLLLEKGLKEKDARKGTGRKKREEECRPRARCLAWRETVRGSPQGDWTHRRGTKLATVNLLGFTEGAPAETSTGRSLTDLERCDGMRGARPVHVVFKKSRRGAKLKHALVRAQKSTQKGFRERRTVFRNKAAREGGAWSKEKGSRPQDNTT